MLRCGTLADEMMHVTRILGGVLLSLAAVAVSAIEGSPLGLWINPAGSVIVEIAEPRSGELRGQIRWASDKAKADARRAGTPSLDNLELMRGFVPAREGTWRGRLFVPDRAIDLVAELRMLDSEHLRVKGCAAGRLVCKSQVWTRIAAEQSHVER